MMNSLQEGLLTTARWLAERLQDLPLIVGMLQGTSAEIDYAIFLRNSAAYVRWTPHLLERAGRRLRERQRLPMLSAKLLEKATEERGHEDWALEDLAALGIEASVMRTRPISPAIRAYIAWNLALVRTAPHAFAATAFILEYISANAAGTAADALRRRGAPFSSALRYLDGHGHADPSHAAEILAAILEIEDRHDQREVLDAGRTVAQMFLRFW